MTSTLIKKKKIPCISDRIQNSVFQVFYKRLKKTTLFVCLFFCYLSIRLTFLFIETIKLRELSLNKDRTLLNNYVKSLNSNIRRDSILHRRESVFSISNSAYGTPDYNTINFGVGYGEGNHI